jgi:hypothetical protein
MRNISNFTHFLHMLFNIENQIHIATRLLQHQ